jgi:putative Ca2+/H+ antiporter (TMEM165/GDT1 family)
VVPARTLQLVAGIGFVLIGTWTLWQALRSA